jgi:hypothetical protein
MHTDQIGLIANPIQRSAPIEMAMDVGFIVDQAGQSLQVIIGYRPDRKLENIREHEDCLGQEIK